MDRQFWEDRYGDADALWSGAPNGVLVAEAAALVVGRALDVGCGEGGDALWLARQGWQVTAVDISQLALDRAAAAAAATPPSPGAVTWRRADLTVEPPEPGAYDLVSLQYFPLARRPGHPGLRGLLAAVAPGGTLLVAGHELADIPRHAAHGFDLRELYQPDEIGRLLGDGWDVLVDETRPRVSPAPPGTGHVRDAVLRARRAADG